MFDFKKGFELQIFHRVGNLNTAEKLCVLHMTISYLKRSRGKDLIYRFSLMVGYVTSAWSNTTIFPPSLYLGLGPNIGSCIIGAPISQYTSSSAMFYPLHSNISKKKQHEKHLCNLSSHYRKYGRFTYETCAPYLNTWKLKCLDFNNVELISKHSKQGIVWEVP